MSKEDVTSPTSLKESILLTGTIDAKENHDVMTADIPNAFIQTNMQSTNSETVMMKIRGPLVDMLLKLDEALY
jgi:hypothetical protein